MAGFQMVHRDGLNVCRSTHDVAALVWLCQQADALGWGAAFEATNTDLCRASGGNRGWVRSFLRRLEAVGVVVVVDGGDRHRPRMVSMSDPRPGAAPVIHDADQDADHGADHPSDERTPTTGGADSPGNPPTEPPGAPSVDRELRLEPEKESTGGAKAAARRSGERDMADQVFTHWRGQRRPGVGDKPGRPWHVSTHFDDDDRRKVIKQLQVRAKAHRSVGGLRHPADLDAALGDITGLIDCFHSSPACSHWQGDNKAKRVYLGLGTLLKTDGMGNRWDTFGDWMATGMPKVEAVTAVSTNGIDGEADKAWAWVLQQIGHFGNRLPRPLIPADPAKDRAVWSAIEAVGDVQALCGRADTVTRLRWRFIDAYKRARQGDT